MNHRDQLTHQLQPVVAALQEALGDDLIALVLFGSQARGDARPESDWDLLLIAEGLADSPWQRQQQLTACLPQAWRYRTNILARTPSEWSARVTSLALDVALDGIVLYSDAHSSIPARLAGLREQLT